MVPRRPSLFPKYAFKCYTNVLTVIEETLPDPKDSKKEESFKVIDRRPFTAEGEIREEALQHERHEASVEPPKESPSRAGATPASPANSGNAADLPQPSLAFENLVRMMASNAAMVLGGYADPRTGQPIVDPEAARELIDMLDALHEKTKGNLTPDEDAMLVDLSGKLKMSYLEITKATAQVQKEKAKARS